MTYSKKNNNAAPFIIIIATLCVGIGMMVFGIFRWTSEVKRTADFIEIEGEIVGLSSHIDDDVDSNPQTMYSAVYGYEVDGTMYTIKENSSSSMKPQIGRPKKVKYNPDNYADAVVISGESHVAITFIGFLFVLISVFIGATLILKNQGDWTIICMGIIFVVIGVGIPIVLDWGLSTLTIIMQIFFTALGLFAVYKGIKSYLPTKVTPQSIAHAKEMDRRYAEINSYYMGKKIPESQNVFKNSSSIPNDSNDNFYSQSVREEPQKTPALEAVENVIENIENSDAVQNMRDFTEEHQEVIQQTKKGIWKIRALIKGIIGGFLGIVFVFVGIENMISGIMGMRGNIGERVIVMTGDATSVLLSMFLPVVIMGVTFVVIGGFGSYKLIRSAINEFHDASNY